MAETLMQSGPVAEITVRESFARLACLIENGAHIAASVLCKGYECFEVRLNRETFYARRNLKTGALEAFWIRTEEDSIMLVWPSPDAFGAEDTLPKEKVRSIRAMQISADLL